MNATVVNDKAMALTPKLLVVALVALVLAALTMLLGAEGGGSAAGGGRTARTSLPGPCRGAGSWPPC